MFSRRNEMSSPFPSGCLCRKDTFQVILFTQSEEEFERLTLGDKNRRGKGSRGKKAQIE